MALPESTILASRLDWLGSDEPSFFERSHSEQEIPKVPHHIPEVIGTGHYQAMHLPLNQVIRKGVFTFSPEASGQLYPLAKITERFTEPVLCIQSVHKGRVVVTDHSSGRDFMVSNNASLFMHADFRHNSASLDTSEDINLVILIIGRSVLNNLIGEEQAHLLLNGLDVGMAPESTMNKVPLHIDTLIHSCFLDHLTGSIARLHAQAKVLEYICGLHKYFASSIENEASKPDIKKLIHQIHHDLMMQEGKLPVITDLARQYGLSPRMLNKEFMSRYGKSLYSYISEVRLNEAHTVLKKTDIPMKTIAKNLGYSHVNHFITAFGKQFGYTPGSLRKKLSSSDSLR